MIQLPKLPPYSEFEQASFLGKTSKNAGTRRREPVSLTVGRSAYATRRRWVASSLTLRGFSATQCKTRRDALAGVPPSRLHVPAADPPPAPCSRPTSRPRAA